MDIQIYSKSDGGKTIITTLLQKIYKSHVSVEDKGREEYYHVYRIEKDEFIAEFYCIQVVSDPFGKEKIVVKRDGSPSEPRKFTSHTVKLDGFTFEAERRPR